MKSFKKIKFNKADLIVTFIVALFCAYMVQEYFNDVRIGVFGLICFFIGLIHKEMQYKK